MQAAKKSVSKRFVLCEGYMDVISMQQAGIDTAVCACGTALTPDQVKLISEYADEVILSYDSDEAGQKATARSLEMFSDSPVKVSILQIPGAKDPDEYIKKYGADRFKALLDGTGNALEFRIAQIRKKYDLKVDKERLDYVKDTLELLAQRASPIERDVYAGRIAEETNISKNAIQEQLASAVKRSEYRRRNRQQQDLLHSGAADTIRVPYAAGGQQARGVAAAEQMVAVTLLRNPAYLAKVQPRLPVENIVMPDMKEAIGAIYRCGAENKPVTLAVLSQMVGEQTLTELSRLVAQYHDVNPTEQDVELYLDRIAHSAPKSSQAAKMSDNEIENYLQSLRDRKQGAVRGQDEED